MGSQPDKNEGEGAESQPPKPRSSEGQTACWDKRKGRQIL